MELIARILRPLKGDDALHRLISQVVTRSRERVCARVYPAVLAMPTAEARGYIRARARQIVQREVEISLSRTADLMMSQRDRAMAMSLEELVSRLSHQLRVQPALVQSDRMAA